MSESRPSKAPAIALGILIGMCFTCCAPVGCVAAWWHWPRQRVRPVFPFRAATGRADSTARETPAQSEFETWFEAHCETCPECGGTDDYGRPLALCEEAFHKLQAALKDAEDGE